MIGEILWIYYGDILFLRYGIYDAWKSSNFGVSPLFDPQANWSSVDPWSVSADKLCLRYSMCYIKTTCVLNFTWISYPTLDWIVKSGILASSHHLKVDEFRCASEKVKPLWQICDDMSSHCALSSHSRPVIIHSKPDFLSMTLHYSYYPLVI